MMASFGGGANTGRSAHGAEAVQLEHLSEHLHDMDVTMQMFDLDGSGVITRAELRKAVEMMHTFAASKKESKRRVVTNAAGQLVVVAAEISDTLIAAELDSPTDAPGA